MLRALLLLAFTLPTLATPLKIVTIGDSLTDGYDEVSKLATIPFVDVLVAGNIYPVPDFPNLDNNPRAFNWPELLSIYRPLEADLGPEGNWGDVIFFLPTGDLRFRGFERNFAIVGTTTLNWTSLLTGVPADDGFSPANLFYDVTKSSLFTQLATADVAVIFLGGNDLKNDYNDIFNTANPSAFLDPIVTRLETIHGAIRTQNATVPIVVATVPDVGATPNLYQIYIDPAKEITTRANIAAMNQTIIATFEAKANTAVARVDRLTDLVFDRSPFHLNGTEFTVEGDPFNPVDHLFCKDDFHPGTAAQALVANEIMIAINSLVPGSMTPFTDREILESTLSLNPDQPYIDWAATYSLGPETFEIDSDGDGLANGLEMLIDTSPISGNGAFTGKWSPGNSLVWNVSSTAERYIDWTAEESLNLSLWTEVPEARFSLTGSTATASPTSEDSSFFRLKAIPKP